MDQRTTVAWVSLTGRKPPKGLAEQFKSRNLTLKTIQLDFQKCDTAANEDQLFWPHIVSKLGASRGVVIHIESDKRRRLAALSNVLLHPRVKYAGTPIGLFLDRAELAKIATFVFKPKGLTDAWRWEAVPSRFSEVAQAMQDKDPGPAPNFKLPLDHGSDELAQHFEVLFQRAFGDCNSLVVRLLGTQGLSGSTVFRAFADHFSAVGTRSKAPFLVKIAKQKDIDREVWNFNSYVKDYIPFHARPNIDDARSSYDSDIGILVASYVEGAVPLLDAVQRGWDPAHISSLLDDCLGKWTHSWKVRKAHPVVTNADRFSLDKFQSNARVLDEISGLKITRKPKAI